jgi:hypothetical protein
VGTEARRVETEEASDARLESFRPREIPERFLSRRPISMRFEREQARNWGWGRGTQLGIKAGCPGRVLGRNTKDGWRLTVRGNSFWTRKRNGWERPHHQLSRERQSACRNGSQQRPWDLGEVWRRKGSCSCLLSGVNGQIGDPELPKVAMRHSGCKRGKWWYS